jgi:hypothetical protein
MLSLVKNICSGSNSMIISALFIIFFISCGDLDRSNPLDPKNPNSHTAQIVLIEAFVSQVRDEPYSNYALDALENLSDDYKNSVIVLEYHVNSSIGDDSLATEENYKRYKEYEMNESKRAVPDIYISGDFARIQGASSVDAAQDRYLEVLPTAINEVSNFTIEAQATLKAMELQINVSVAQLGKDDAQNVLINGVIVRDYYTKNQRQVVSRFTLLEAISTLEAGTIQTFKFSMQLTPDIINDDLQVIVFGQVGKSGPVLQAVRAELDT